MTLDKRIITNLDKRRGSHTRILYHDGDEVGKEYCIDLEDEYLIYNATLCNNTANNNGEGLIDFYSEIIESCINVIKHEDGNFTYKAADLFKYANLEYSYIDFLLNFSRGSISNAPCPFDIRIYRGISDSKWYILIDDYFCLDLDFTKDCYFVNGRVMDLYNGEGYFPKSNKNIRLIRIRVLDNSISFTMQLFKEPGRDDINIFFDKRTNELQVGCMKVPFESCASLTKKCLLGEVEQRNLTKKGYLKF